MGSVKYSGESALSDTYTGGILGSLQYRTWNRIINSQIRNSANYGAIEQGGTSKNAYIGGIVGYSYESDIENSANYGSITYNGISSEAYIGGLFGYSYSNVNGCLSGGAIAVNNWNNTFAGSLSGTGYNTDFTGIIWTRDTGLPTTNMTILRYSSFTNVIFVDEPNETAADVLNAVGMRKTWWSKWIVVNLNEGQISTSTEDTIAVPHKALPAPKKEGYRHTHWCIDFECTNIYNPQTTNITEVDGLYAQYVPLHTAEFEFGDGRTAKRNFIFNEAINYPQDPVRKGYVFIGWNTHPDSMPDNNIKITALWEKLYTVTFDFGNGTVEEKFFTRNTTIDYPQDPVREGYVFIGWNGNFAVMPDNDIRITALWTQMAFKYVEVVIGKKDMTDNQIEEALKELTDKKFTIEQIDRDMGSGNIIVIIKFEDEKSAVEFVRNVNKNARENSDSFIRSAILKDSKELGSFSSRLFPNLAFVAVSAFAFFFLF